MGLWLLLPLLETSTSTSHSLPPTSTARQPLPCPPACPRFPPPACLQGHPMALQRLAAFFQDQYFQAKGHRKPVMLIGPRTGEGRCLVIGYEATQRMRVSRGQGQGSLQLVSCWTERGQVDGPPACTGARASQSAVLLAGDSLLCLPRIPPHPPHPTTPCPSPTPRHSTRAGQQAGHGVPGGHGAGGGPGLARPLRHLHLRDQL